MLQFVVKRHQKEREKHVDDKTLTSNITQAAREKENAVAISETRWEPNEKGEACRQNLTTGSRRLLGRKRISPFSSPLC